MVSSLGELRAGAGGVARSQIVLYCIPKADSILWLAVVNVSSFHKWFFLFVGTAFWQQNATYVILCPTLLHPALVAILFEINRLKKPPLIFTEIHPPPLKNSKKDI